MRPRDLQLAASSPGRRAIWLGRVDARIRFVVVLAMICNVAAAKSLLYPALVAAVCLVCAWGIPRRLLVARLSAALSVALVLALVQALGHGATPLVEFNVVGLSVTLWQEGMVAGGLVIARLLGAAAALMLLTWTTSMHELLVALRWLRVPACWIDVAMLTARYALVLVDTARVGAEALQLRQGRGGLRIRLGSLGTLAGAVMLRSMDQAQAAHEAMLLRGYTADIPTAPPPPLGSRGTLWILAALAAPTAAMLLAGLVGAMP